MNSRFKDKWQKIIEEIIKSVVIVIIYFISNDIFTDKDITRKLIDAIGIIMPMAIYMLIILFASFITKPIILSLGINNYKLRGEEKTDIYHHSTEREDQRTIVVSIELINKDTLWSKLAKTLYKNSKIEVMLTIQPPDDKLLIQPSLVYDNVEEFSNNNGSGFLINISDIILSRLNYNIPTRREYKFIINENRDDLPQSDEKYFINPKLIINDKELKFIDKKFICINSLLTNGYYVINYIR